MNGRVLVSVEIDVREVRVGDQLMIGGQPFTVRDITSLAAGRKKVDFASGESLIMLPTTILWAARHIDPRITRRRRSHPGAR
ncbi:hypothetical protein [Streptomyces johnsoniae]|uniref:Uncharacterized protein n=1 Tax=Streptomyces johnsoniae TaxID=3075532 RepID=A0ABU2SD42_9ACTN|nr:hypothetical protein [Streptomyces sp. DSM 41886]MDT0446812.1 hypothetical protein [Streptomyces sp. DSM 41886]